jgi:hypothetical protein
LRCLSRHAGSPRRRAVLAGDIGRKPELLSGRGVAKGPARGMRAEEAVPVPIGGNRARANAWVRLRSRPRRPPTNAIRGAPTARRAAGTGFSGRGNATPSSGGPG